MSNCPECTRPLKNKDSCACGWKNENFTPIKPKECFACHLTIQNDQYFRVFYNKKEKSERYKCDKCLVYADLTWYDKAIIDFQREHTEFAVKPADKAEAHDMVMMAKSFLKSPSRKATLPENPQKDSEQELLNQLPKGMFEDLHDKSICP